MAHSRITSKTHSTAHFSLAKWSIFSVLICTYILVYFHRMAPGVVAENLMATFQTTGTQLGSLSAIYFFIYAFMQIPSGVLADTLGTRTAIVAGNLTAGLGSIIFGMATTFTTVCLGRFLVGLGVSVVFVSIMKNNSVWFEERVFGFMSGLTLLFGNLGSVLAAGPLAALLDYYTWRSIFSGIGCVSIILGIIGFFIVKNKPEDLGFSTPTSPAIKSVSTANKHWLKNLLSVLRMPRIWPGFWVQFGMIGGLYSFMGLWAIPYLRNIHGLERSNAADYVTLMLLSFAFGALFFGWFSDRIGKRKPVLLASVAGYLLCWLVMVYSNWQPGYAGFLLFACMGFTGSGFVLTFACAKEIAHPQLSGMAVSVVNTGCFIGTSVMQPLFGWIADLSWDGQVVNGTRLYSATDYHYGFLGMLAFAVIGMLAALKIQETLCRNISSKLR